MGQHSNNKFPDAVKNLFIEIVRKKYPDFGPTFAREKLTERHDATFSIETLRKWMIETRIWTPHIKAKKRLLHQS